MSNTLLRIYPSELKIPFELKRQNSGILELTNKTDHYVAFKVKTTNPRKYSVRPTTGIVLPRGSCGITISMQPPKEIPTDYHCKDKFLIQSVVVEDGTTQKDIHSDMFSKEAGKVVEEFKLRVVYIPANPPSPVPEEEEDEIDSLDSDVDHEVQMPSTFDAASRKGYTSGSQASHDEGVSLTKAVLSKYVDENQKLQQELDLLKKKRSSSDGGFTALFVPFVFAFFVFIGYLMAGSNV
uniref:MSP domain-containing protein n=1 Tax=Oryza rufipogon TaxID=4529 RepID=A0A0E0NIT4_ORYRU